MLFFTTSQPVTTADLDINFILIMVILTIAIIWEIYLLQFQLVKAQHKQTLFNRR